MSKKKIETCAYSNHYTPGDMVCGETAKCMLPNVSIKGYEVTVYIMPSDCSKCKRFVGV